MGWTIKLDNGTKTHTLALNDALRQGFNFLIDSEKLTLDVPVNATGVAQYVVGVKILLYHHQKKWPTSISMILAMASNGLYCQLKRCI